MLRFHAAPAATKQNALVIRWSPSFFQNEKSGQVKSETSAREVNHHSRKKAANHPVNVGTQFTVAQRTVRCRQELIAKEMHPHAPDMTRDDNVVRF
jgi:hypothetical protein